MNQQQNKKYLIALSSPSGGGKSTIARHVLHLHPECRFSISATTRNKRARELHGKDYYFLTKEEFQQKIENGDFVEYEEIFGNIYGTLHSEIRKAIAANQVLLFDVDVKGALYIKAAYPTESLLIFIAPPSMEALEERLRRRSTESDEQIATRLARSEMELAEKDKFDYVIINENLEEAFKQMEEILAKEVFMWRSGND
ncbi:MAG: Guanylate kinase [Ignavibacteria bacterium]|nr:Guanylate kinase [Ignavibacteria bacterium]